MRLPLGRDLKYFSDSSRLTFGHRAGDADLPLQLRPEERQRGVLIWANSRPLRCRSSCRKMKPRVRTLEQHRAGRWFAIRTNRRERHRINLDRVLPSTACHTS